MNTLTEGGAANALKRIHFGLLKNGIDSKVLSLYRLPENENIPNWYCFLDFEQGILDRFIRSLKYRTQKWSDPFHFYSSPRSIFEVENHELIEWADVINLHWVANFVNYPTFFNHPGILSKPLVWRTPDLFPMRGVVHYDSSINDKNRDLELRAVDLKAKHVKNHENLHVVATSKWTLSEAINSSILNEAKSFNLIHNALDVSKFKVTKVRPLRDQKLKQLLFISARLDNEKKGLLVLLRMLTQIDMSGWELVVVGAGKPPEFPVNFIIKYLGAISSESEIINVYTNADIYLSTAHEEAFGQTVIEAMLCGKPIIAFGVGGILDTVEHEKTGYLVKLGDLSGFKNYLVDLMCNHDKRLEFGQNAEQRAVMNFGSESQIEKYVRLYKKILNE